MKIFFPGILSYFVSILAKSLIISSQYNIETRDRSPVVSLGIFSEASDKSMCPGSTQPFEMSSRIFLGVKAAGA
jgi:hypothetical protein